MSVLTKTSAILVAASALAFAVQASAQQDSETIRAQCIEQASKSFPGTAMEGPESRARVETYISCMRKNGLNP
jgi:uncharacterized membrane-anchored protein